MKIAISFDILIILFWGMDPKSFFLFSVFFIKKEATL